MNVNDIHLIKGEPSAVFHHPTFTLIEINNLVYDILTRVKKDESIESIAIELKLKPADIETLLTNISKSIPNDSNQGEKNLASKKGRSIHRITLHVANKCNLRCKYCYANGGDYNQPESMMTMDTASKFVDFCTTHFDEIKTIVFFGGEPLLNPKPIQFICESFEHLYKGKKIGYLPEWGIITNGTILNDYILNLIKQYMKFITVSIDGPQNLNDFNRRFKNGKGSYAKIANFIKKVQNETDVHLKYEATYTSYHSQNNWTESDVKSFLTSEFNISGSLVHDLNHPETVNVNNSQGMGFPEGFFNILNAIAYKVQKEMCLVGNNIVAISTDGKIYPCHMNYGKEHLSLGNITSDNIFNSPDKYLSKFPYLKSLLKIDKPCIDCWAKPICGGCAMRWFYNGKADEYNSLPDRLLCETNKKHIEAILLLIIRLRKDKPKWTELLQKITYYDDYDYFL